MRGFAAKASIFFLWTLRPAVTYSLPTHKFSNNTVTQNGSALLWRDFDGVYVQLEASCATCSPASTWPVQFFIGSTNSLCENATVAVNGREISYQWEDQFASGAGIIPSTSLDISAELHASWQSICITPPLSARHERNALIFTLIFDTDLSDGDGLEDKIGFTLSLGNEEEIEVLRASNFPVGFGDGLEWEEWASHWDNSIDSGSVSLDMQLEAELQRLQVLQYEAQQLQRAAAMQEMKILQLLNQDCKSLFAKWEQCEDFFCYLRSSWQKLPEFYWYIRYRFGLLGSGKIIPICRPTSERHTDPDHPSAAPSQSDPTPSNHAIPTVSVSVSPTTSATTSEFQPAITPSPHEIDSDSESTPYEPDASISGVLPLRSSTKEFFRSCAILLLIILVFGLFFRVIRHKTTFLRRRRDLASRHEELRTQRAYRNAARRLRWRQWWEGQSYFQTASVTSNHSLSEFVHARGVNESDESYRPLSRGNNNDTNSDDEDEEPEQRIMQAEILGLRRVLEYVGQLVGTDGTPTATSISTSTRRRTRSRSLSRSQSVPPPYEHINPNVIVSGGGGSSSISNAPQSHNNRPHHLNHLNHLNHNFDLPRSGTPGIVSASGGPSSPRASTMFSLETGSLVTLETLDTLDSGTAPPSYHP